ncbi:glycosyltransferase [Clostridium botulinum]|nr:glycosyltransferase [Clostridium botulinum]NFL58275.1 glycosyltransferase [Clostridium botulinum]NFL62957.1 glycosyltransferase [Clostridium botulinum]NFO67956.1 glycosyltransferase [Clostridium botulinum]
MDKNILYFTRTMGLGGTEKVILQLCNNFKGKFKNIIVCSNGGIHEKELKKLGIKHYKINDIENKNPINIAKTFISLMKIVNTEKIDVIHTHHRMAAFYVSLLRKFKNIGFIHTAHNTFTDKKFLTNLVLRNANIVAVGKKVKENLCQFYRLNSNKIKVIYNGIEKDTNVIKEIPEIKKYKDKGYFIVGNIGRLSKQKGMEYYIEAIPNVLKNNNKVMFYIIGDGEDKEKLENLSETLGIKKNLIFLGYRNDVCNVIKQLDLVVLSSLWEGLPLTPIETFSEGKTIIATNIDGTPEIVEDGVNGLLIEVKNSISTSDNINKLCNDIELKKELEDNALKKYEEMFTIDSFIKNYKYYYKKVME